MPAIQSCGMNEQNRSRIFLIALAVMGSALVWVATSRYGPGLSTDGARYLSSAESIAAGRGLIDYLGLPLVNWPPLYSLILAGLITLTGLDVLVLAQWVNILTFGAIIYVGGIFFQRSLPGNEVFAVIASLILATSLPLIEISANAASDPLFLLCVLLFMLTAQTYMRERSQAAWGQMVVWAIAACFLRYAGLALVLSGAVIVLWTWRANWRQALVRAAVFGLVAGSPLATWALFHNLPASGTLLGTHRAALGVTNFEAMFEKIAGWFIPGSLVSGWLAVILFAAIAVGLLAASNRKRRAAWFAKMQGSQLFPALAFAAVYGAMLVVAISTSEHRFEGSQRIHAVLLPAFLVLVGSVLADLPPRLPAKVGRVPLRSLLLAAFALWLVIPLFRAQAYVRASRAEGDVSFYNIYNTRTLREADIVAEIQAMEFGEEEKVYSNNEAAAWFFLRRRIFRLPRYDVEAGDVLETSIRSFDGWPAGNEEATLIWFERELDYKELVPTPQQMADFIELIVIFTGRYGDIYLMDVE